jgi:3-phosphoinositide dependent protein kinase-1
MIERDILTKCNHPNIIKLLKTFQDKEKLYFGLEYAPNRDLASFIRSQGVLSFEVAKFYTSEIVYALDYLHKKGIAHRDLKPENMMLDSNWHIKIVFFC